MHEAGMFKPIDYSLWDQEALEGTPPHTRFKDAVVGLASGLVLSYDQRVFPEAGPQNWADFWDIKKFPGPRGLDFRGKHAIQFALLADGVAHKDIWPLTDDKLDRAFAKLNEIKPHVAKWWTGGGEATQLMINKEYTMADAFDGRLISAIHQGAPIKFVWEGCYLTYTYMTILNGGPNTANAQKLLAFLNRAQIAAAWTQATGYPGPNANQVKYLPPKIIPLVSVDPQNAVKCIIDDANWLVEKRPDGKTNGDHVQERFLTWRTQ